MRKSISIFFLIAGTSMYAQLRLIPIVEKGTERNSRIEKIQSNADTMDLPFWDDFVTSEFIIDSSKWQNSPNIFINNSLAINPPSIFVATFDGVDSRGNAYSQEVNFSGLGDELESNPIDLTKVPDSRKNTVYLSFFWQLQGYGELPDEDDSLVLQFYDRDSTWVSQDINGQEDGTALVGGNENIRFNTDSLQEFTQVIVPVSGARFFHEGFKFKFQSFSNLSGIYDTWHVDYVYLNEFRDINDRAVIDRALTGQPTLLFDPYYEMPLKQFLQNPGRYNTVQQMGASNLGANLRPIDPFHHFVNTNTGETTVLFDTLPPIGINAFETGKIFNGKDLSGLPLSGDSTVIESIFSFFTGDTLLSNQTPDGTDIYYPVDLRVNDTLKTRYTLHDYYAYDDGSAEFAAGINLIGGELAVAFFIETADILSGIDIHFPTVSPPSVGEAIDIKVWRDLDELPLRLQPVKVELASRNEFQRFELSTPVEVSDTFFIGYRQFTNNYIGVGFDRNNSGGSQMIWTNTNRTWENNDRLIGSLMIRPVFNPELDSTNSPKLGSEERIRELIVYPNPVKNNLMIKGNHQFIEIVSLDGRLIYKSKRKDSHDVSAFKDGLYILGIFDNDLISTRKIIISK